MKIGALAKAVNCHVETVRYYEKIGLLPPCDRAQNGYGEYSVVHLKLLRLIRYSKELGFSQKQVRELVALAGRKNIGCDAAHKMIVAQSEVVEQKIKSLVKLKNALRKISIDCNRSGRTDCPAFEDIMTGTR